MKKVLNYKTFGEGFPLVILHGLFGSLDNWQTIGKQWAKMHQVVLVDLPNHGKSPHTNTFSYTQMAESVAELCQELGFTKIHLLGHSMGGKTAMHFAFLFPELVQKLIVVDIAPKKYPPHHQDIIAGLYAFNPLHISSRTEAEEAMAKVITNTGVRQFLLKNLKRTDTGYAWKMNLDLLSDEINQVTGDTNIETPINTPTLFIRGALSNYILDTDFDSIKKGFPQSEIKTIENAGHWVHAEQPKALFEVVNEFLVKN